MASTTLRCPNCNAPLTRSGGQDPTECPYCHAALEKLPAAATTSRPPASSTPFVAFGAITALVIIGGIGFVAIKPAPPAKPEAPATPSVPVARLEKPKPPPPPPSPVKEVLSFGEEGTNPGQLQDARQLTVSSDGSIFIADYSSGRVQQFSAEGTYVGQLDMAPDKLTKQLHVFALASDAVGHVYVNRVGDVLVYDAATRKLVRTIAGDYPDRYYHGGIAVDGAGVVYAITDRTGDLDLLKVSPQGKVLSKTRVDARDVAVDGVGRTFLVGDDGLEVRGPKGEIQTKVGGLRSRTISFDGKGHLFIPTGSTVEVLSDQGTKVLSLPVHADEIALDAKGRLYALERKKVTVYEVTLP